MPCSGSFPFHETTQPLGAGSMPWEQLEDQGCTAMFPSRGLVFPKVFLTKDASSFVAWNSTSQICAGIPQGINNTGDLNSMNPQSPPL